MCVDTRQRGPALAWSAGNADRCIRLAEAARWYPGVTLGVQGMVAQMSARGHALDGEAGDTRRLLEEARELINRAGQHREDEPDWMYFYGETWLTIQRDMCELHLGAWDSAAALLAAGLGELPESYRRDRAWYGSQLARAYAGNAEGAEQLRTGELRDVRDVLARRGARQSRTIGEAIGGDSPALE
jgi:hypothetical protein